MNLDAYSVIKAVHVAAAITFVAGVLLATITLSAAGKEQAGPSALLVAIRQWDTRVTTPAMLLVWALGLTLTMLGHWLPSGWLIAKLLLVVLLSGLHGVTSGRLRRLASGATAVRGIVSPLLVVAVATIIVFLVVTKPL